MLDLIARLAGVAKRTVGKTAKVMPICEILVRMGAITAAEVALVRTQMRAQDEGLLADILIAFGPCSADAVKRALRVQAAQQRGDTGEAALDLMEARLDVYGRAEDDLAMAIARARLEHRTFDNAEDSGVWLLPFPII